MTTPNRSDASLVPLREMARTKRAQQSLGSLQTERAEVDAFIVSGRRHDDAILRSEATVAEPTLLLRRAKLDVEIAKALRTLTDARESDRQGGCHKQKSVKCRTHHVVTAP